MLTYCNRDTILGGGALPPEIALTGMTVDSEVISAIARIKVLKALCVCLCHFICPEDESLFCSMLSKRTDITRLSFMYNFSYTLSNYTWEMALSMKRRLVDLALDLPESVSISKFTELILGDNSSLLFLRIGKAVQPAMNIGDQIRLVNAFRCNKQIIMYSIQDINIEQALDSIIRAMKWNKSLRGLRVQNSYSGLLSESLCSLMASSDTLLNFDIAGSRSFDKKKLEESARKCETRQRERRLEEFHRGVHCPQSPLSILSADINVVKMIHKQVVMKIKLHF